MPPTLIELKDAVRTLRPPGDPLRETILAEGDECSAEAYEAKAATWLTLLRLGAQTGGRAR